MGYIRQLPSGLWANTIHTPVGRITETHELRGALVAWEQSLKADINRGDFIDPRLAKKPVGEAWEKYAPARRVELATRKRDESHWKVWVAPRWSAEPIGGILKPDVQKWVNDLDEELGPEKAWTTIAALNVLKTALELAIDAGWIKANPARRVRPPVAPAHVDRVLDADEEVAILDRLDDLFPGRRDGRLFVETMLETGGRWEEIAAVRREAVNLRTALVALGPVMERDGTIREYPKGARSRNHPAFRDGPLGTDLLARLRPVVLATKPGGLVFTAPKGGPLLYPTWRSRVWVPALRVPVLDEDGKRTGWAPLVAEPLPTPHDTRHTFGTRLADAGIPQHDRMALMGHKDVRSGQRYTHSGDRRFDAAREALRRARAGS
jgi:integrase